MSKIPLRVLALLSLVACGGGGGDSASDDYQMALQQANAKEAEAIALAPASPCSQAPQCANLTFTHLSGSCASPSYHPYSLISPTAAAASAAAADEQALAEHALAIAPPPYTPCPLAVTLPPTLACVANTCQAATSP